MTLTFPPVFREVPFIELRSEPRVLWIHRQGFGAADGVLIIVTVEFVSIKVVIRPRLICVLQVKAVLHQRVTCVLAEGTIIQV